MVLSSLVLAITAAQWWQIGFWLTFASMMAALYGMQRALGAWSRDQRMMTERQALAFRLIEVDGGVPYLMRPGETPEADSYEHLGEGIEALVGIPAAKIDHQAWVDLMQEVVPDDPTYRGEPADYGKAFQIGRVEIYRVRIRIRTPDGREKWLTDRSVPLRDEVSGRLVGTMGVLREVTGG